MSQVPALTFITVCKARLEHLKRSMPAAAAQAPCIVVDYACPEGTGSWVEDQHPSVTVVRVGRGTEFNLSAGRNAGAAAARTDWLCFLDADVVPDENFVAAVDPLLRPGRYLRPLPLTQDNWGFLLCQRADFARSGGYDEGFAGWGGEDDDLCFRLEARGISRQAFPSYLLHPIEHDDALRMRFHGPLDRALSRQINSVYTMMKRDVAAVTGAEVDIPVRHAMYAEARRVLSQSVPAGAEARLEIDLPDAILQADWSARRSMRYTIPPPPTPVATDQAPRSLTANSADARSPMPFIVGTGRCGSTLLRLMLDSHPDLAIPDEIIFMPALLRLAVQGARTDELLRLMIAHHSWPSFGVDAREVQALAGTAQGPPLSAVLRAFYDSYAKRFSKKRSGDKTIVNTPYVAVLSAVLPEARFIHLIRDGRDVAVSMRGLWFGMDDLADAASYWATTILNVRAAVEQARCLELRYEDLVAAPEAALRRVCEYLELSWQPQMLDYHEGAGQRLAESPDGVAWDGRRIPADAVKDAHALTERPPTKARIGMWKERLSTDERAQFELIAGPLLSSLGYERSS